MPLSAEIPAPVSTTTEPPCGTFSSMTTKPRLVETATQDRRSGDATPPERRFFRDSVASVSMLGRSTVFATAAAALFGCHPVATRSEPARPAAPSVDYAAL